MKLTDFLTLENIIPSLEAEEKRAVLEELISNLIKNEEGVNKETLIELLLAREKLGSTGIGYGVAIPHGRVKGLEHIILSFGRSLKGAEFQSLDNRPVFLFFLILVPDQSTSVHVKLLAHVSQILKNSACRDRLMRASSSEEIYKIIVEKDKT